MARGKHKQHTDHVLELNLNPMMDLFAVLIPALLMMSAVVEVTVINVSAPAIGASDDSKPPPTPEKPPLNLTVSILEGGYLLSGAGGVLSGSGVEPQPPQPDQVPTIPLVQKNILCSKFRGTWPPPRDKNRVEAPCAQPLDNRRFWIYDLEALTHKAAQLKDAYPEERRVVLQAGSNVEYESLIDAMDALRDIRDAAGATRVLFDEVVLGAPT